MRGDDDPRRGGRPGSAVLVDFLPVTDGVVQAIVLLLHPHPDAGPGSDPALARTLLPAGPDGAARVPTARTGT